jgi:alpha-ribazole phosphatase
VTAAPTCWWWVRHAPIVGAPAHIYGQSDVGCDTGDRQAFHALADLLPSDAVWVISSLRRTRETAEAIAAAGMAVPVPHVEPDFAEQNFGRWQGLTWEEMEAADPALYAAFWRDPTRNVPPEGESYVTQIARTRAAFERLTAEHPGRNVVSVSHGGTIRAAVAVSLDLTPEAAMAVVIDNLSVTRINHVEDGLLRSRARVWQIQGVNMPCRWIR